MSFEEKIKAILRPGIVEFSPGEISTRELYTRVKKLCNEGHAVSLDETFSSQHVLVQVRVFHALTCTACARRRRGDVVKP